MAAPWTRPDAPRMMAAGALAVASRMPSMSVHVPSHQQADALMKQEDEFSAAILETVAALVAVFDRAGHVVQFNRACQQVTGYTWDEVQGRSIWELPLLVPEEIDALKGVFAELTAGHFPNRYENAWVTKDGRRRLIVWSNTALLGPDGSVEYVIGTGLDITDQRRAEAQLTDAQHLAQLGSWEWDLTTDTVTWSDALYRICGVDQHAFHATYDAVLQLVHPDDRGDLESLIHRAHRTHEPYACEHRIIRPDGTTRVLHSRGAVVVNDAGQVIRMFGTGQDITERKQVEDALYASEARLKAALQEKEVLLKEVYHRVKNNLQVVASLLHLHSEGIEDPAMLARFQESQHRIQSMALVHEALYQADDLAHVNVAAYMRTLATYLMRAYDIDGSRITLDIYADEIVLPLDTAIPCGLILNELLSNALKYAFPAGRAGAIALDLHAEATQVRLRVQDTGVGFPIGLDFRRTDSLGLRLVCLLAEQLRGTIELAREGGTTMTVTFPWTASERITRAPTASGR